MATKFIKSAADIDGCPVSDLVEIAVIGRSNVGKSSLINAWLGGAYAKVSQTPGKTELLNFFLVRNEFILVDMPGYGYSAKSKAKRETWTPMIENYLGNRPQLKGVVLIVDAAREWTEDEDNLLDWLKQYDIEALLVLNKCDRLNQSERAKKKNEMAKVKPPVVEMLWVSAKEKTGIEELKRTVFENFVRA